MEIVRPRQTYQPSIQKTRKWSPATSEAIKKKRENYKCDKLQRRNHENIKQVWGTIENTTRFQSDPIGKFVNLSEKTSQLLRKNLNFVSTPKVYNKRKLNEEMKTFYRTKKLQE